MTVFVRYYADPPVTPVAGFYRPDHDPPLRF
jgi:hypothetical protein